MLHYVTNFMGIIRLRLCRPEAVAEKSAKLLFENGREDEKASAGGAQVFLETRAPTFNSTTCKKVVPAQHIYKYKYERQRDLIL